MSAGGKLFLHGARQPIITTPAITTDKTKDLIMSPLSLRRPKPRQVSTICLFGALRNMRLRKTSVCRVMVGVLQRESLENPAKQVQ